MSLFSILISSRKFNPLDRTSVWKYGLTEEDYQNLKSHIKDASLVNLDPRDAFLYYAEWWKNEYNGGKPSKKMIFDSIGGTISTKMDEKEFYKMAKDGARRLGVKWLVRNNTLYFRTMLMQGGLPLRHISENSNHYLNFLMAVIEEQPVTVEDFAFNAEIIALLPKSSQNEHIYENCLAIVRSILNEENLYDNLLKNYADIDIIFQKLREKSKSIQRKAREVKPKNYWLLSKKDGKYTIELRVGLSDTYKKEELANILGFEIGLNEYQLYINDELFCVFRKMLSGDYKTNWYRHMEMLWDASDRFPNVYVIMGDEKIEVHDFIQIVPDLSNPSLWTKYSDDEWRLMKGTGTTHDSAFVLHPKEWKVSCTNEEIEIYGYDLNFTSFEGEIIISKHYESRIFKCGVHSFDWLVIGDKPRWMLRSNMPVVRKTLEVLVYDETGKRVESSDVSLSINKRGGVGNWLVYESGELKLPGFYELKIEYNGLIAYDSFYNIGQFNIQYDSISLNQGSFRTLGNQLDFSLTASNDFEINVKNNKYDLIRGQQTRKIPQSISARLREGNRKSLRFEMDSPLKGIALIDGMGNLVPELDTLRLEELHGLRILTDEVTSTTIVIRNNLNDDVKIVKTIKMTCQPLISLKEDLYRLFYLADTMRQQNRIELELSNKIATKTYKIAGFSLYLRRIHYDEGSLMISNLNDLTPDLILIPLNVKSSDIEPIILIEAAGRYVLSSLNNASEFILISAGKYAGHLMPLYICIDENIEKKSRFDRLNNYHSLLTDNSFDHESWKVLQKYFSICNNYGIPFTSFDQIRAVSGSSKIAAKTFLFLGQNARDSDEFIQIIVPRLEQELGFNFHWICKQDWEDSMNELVEYVVTQPGFTQAKDLGIISEDMIYNRLVKLINEYFDNIGLIEVLGYIHKNKINHIGPVTHQQIQALRAGLGSRVLSELPRKTPITSQDYGLPVDQHKPVRLLLKSPIAAAESIVGIENIKSIWSFEDLADAIRRNMQYAQYLNPEFYKTILIHTLQQN